jgi:RNA polymerase II subunit A small phosphatase-like protein
MVTVVKPQQGVDGSRSSTPKLLILDLDETLFHASEQPLDSPCDCMLLAGFHVYIRPHLTAFLHDCFDRFDVAVWTSASADYASQMVAALFPHAQQPRFLWHRQHCVQRFDSATGEIHYIKDLKKIKRKGYDLSQVIVVDDSPEKLQRNYGNLVRVQAFMGEPDDELLHAMRYLTLIQHERDIRTLEKRWWQSQVCSIVSRHA